MVSRPASFRLTPAFVFCQDAATILLGLTAAFLYNVFIAKRNVVIEMVFLHALEGVLTIVIMVSVGYFLAARGWFNQANSPLLPRLVNYVALPAYMLWNLMSTFDQSTLEHMLYGLAVPLLSMALCFAAAFAVAILIGVASNHRGTFQAVFCCSSSIFVGLPVNLALFGETSVPYVLLYFLSNALFFWTIGNYCISRDGKAGSPKIFSLETLKNIFSPPLIGFVTALVLILLGIRLPDFIINTAKYLGGMTTPLSMLFIGTVVCGVKLRNLKLTRDMVAALAGRFIVSPLAVLAVVYFIPIPLLMKKVFVIQAALPAITQTTIMAKVYEADTEYAAVLVSLTTILAMIAIPAYMVILS